MLPSNGDSFPHLIQKRRSQLGFVTHLLTYLRTSLNQNFVLNLENDSITLFTNYRLKKHLIQRFRHFLQSHVYVCERARARDTFICACAMEELRNKDYVPMRIIECKFSDHGIFTNNELFFERLMFKCYFIFHDTCLISPYQN